MLTTTPPPPGGLFNALPTSTFVVSVATPEGSPAPIELIAETR